MLISTEFLTGGKTMRPSLYLGLNSQARSRWNSNIFLTLLQMLSSVYNDRNWPGNQLKPPRRRELSRVQVKRWFQYDNINKALDPNFIPNFVVVFTWLDMLPPWDAENEVRNRELIYTKSSSKTSWLFMSLCGFMRLLLELVNTTPKAQAPNKYT